MDSLPRFHRWGSSVGLSEKSRHKWSSASNISRQSNAGSAYHLELEQLIDTFRRSVLLATDSPMSPPSPRPPSNGLLHHGSLHFGIPHHPPRGGNHNIGQFHRTPTLMTANTTSSLNSALDPLHDAFHSALNSPVDHHLSPLAPPDLEGRIGNLTHHTASHYASVQTRGHLGQHQHRPERLQSLVNQQQIQQITEQDAAIQQNHENGLHARESLIFSKEPSSNEFTMALCSDNDDVTEGPLNIQDVFHTLQQRHVLITGGQTCEGHPVLHLPDTGTFCQIPDDHLRRLLRYLAGVPLPHEQNAGFVIVVDRRRDKWSSVKTVLLKISGFFPGIIQIVFVLKPTGFLQKALSEVSHKLFRDEFNFQVVLLGSTSELHSYIHPCQLTQDVGGHLPYDHRLWCDQRAAVEKYSMFLAELTASIREVSRQFQETELPNDADTTYNLLQDQGGEYQCLKDSLLSAAQRGKDLLAKVRVQPPEVIPYNALDIEDARQRQQRQRRLNGNENIVRQMMAEIAQHERDLDSFWLLHKERLNQCLQLRRFETQFKEVHMNMAANIRDVRDMVELGDCVTRVDTLLSELEHFHKIAEDDLEKADHLQRIGSRLLEGGHYAMDSIEPKCVELKRLCLEFKDSYQRRREKLVRYRNLQERIERANRWCTEGIELLAGLHIDKCSSPDFAKKALEDLNRYLETVKEFQMGEDDEYFEDFINNETRPLLQQVLKRIDDVRMMCINRQASFRKLAASRPAPKSTAAETPAYSGSDIASNTATKDSSKDVKKDSEQGSPTSSTRSSLKSKIEVQLPLEISCASLTSPTEKLKDDKRGHVMQELIETEKSYVAELNSVVEGYQKQMSNAELKPLIPPPLVNRADVLFGNMADILAFHRDVFLGDLQGCQTTPEQVGQCFVQRSEEFHQLYSVYCMNKPRSEALRAQCANDDAFFKECQRRLQHKLPLDAYLLKPVQRITKYQLLLKDLLKYATLRHASASTQQLQQAVDTMLDVLRHVNDSMHQVSITGFHGSLSDYGKLLLQGPFNVWMEEKKRERSVKDLRFKPSRRYIFLYEQLVLFTKRQGRDENLSYAFKNALKTSQIGLTENLKGRGDKRKFEVWLHGRSQVFTIQAPTAEVKEQWLRALKGVLLHQFELLKDENSRKYIELSSYISTRPIIQHHRPMRHNTIGGPNSTSGVPGHLAFSALGGWERHHSLQSTPISTPTASLGLGEHYSSNSSLSALPNFTFNLQSSADCRAIPGCEGPQQKSPLGRRATLPALRRRADSDVEDGWSTDDLRSDEDDDEELFVPPSQVGHLYLALGDYSAVDVGEASLCEGQTVQVMRVGCAGWWYVRGVDQTLEGWVPASYLGAVATTGGANTAIGATNCRVPINTRSSPSISSQDSGCGVGPSGPGLRHTYSRNSVASNLSTTSLDP
ncbi:guanine nucleotide exchange factor DBS-like [Varroa jacobsoni]|uniref:guanine nucleotide exchange factor DBS-like n=1 Tax=Varroa jacobsoni TaxID=62625 RepID=UPI000BFA716E|nr:guanine nucleotide exchange factor DBS-like [Varroa jacobsoni]